MIGLNFLSPNVRGRGQRGLEPKRDKESGSVREAGKEGAGSGIPKVAGRGRNMGKLPKIVTILDSKSAYRREPEHTGREPASKGTKGEKFGPPLPYFLN